jgi:hypothetical protein
MVEAVRTAASTLGIWVIVAVAMIVLAAWLVGIYVADNYQTRLSRQRRRMGAPGPVLTDAGVSAASSIPGQRRDAGQPEPEPAPEPTPETAAARGRHARPADYYAAADYYGTADYKAAEKTPAGYPETRARGVGDAATGGQAADAPTRPDLPAQQGQPDVPAQPGQPDLQGRPDVPAQPGQPDVPGQAAQPSSGRHAMPAQRSGASDRAERTYAGPDADHQDDDEDQR